MKKNPTWKSVFFKSPGPNTWSEALILGLKGLVMGAADIIPGVSGGTIAFITGIYEKLITAIKSVDISFVKKIAKFELKEAVGVLHLRFLLSLGSGIAISIICFSGLMNHLLITHPIFTWSFFFGLILASIFVIGKKINCFKKEGGMGLAAGIASGFFIVGVIPVITPETWWFIVLSGMIAICAMILPGLSGSFILLILGKYEFMTGALKNPFVFDNACIIILFITGCAVGVIGFSRILSYFFNNYYNLTLSFLTGLIVGSLRKIWPWKETIESKIMHGKLTIIKEQNILPAFDHDFFLSFVLIIIGILLVFSLA
ncbi:MAG: DUF368 domain-containing protein, partial [Desulfobacterales bacterium]|nr:DUF368 domain-containing protein [Desulfobacterales bacterium]